MTLRFLLLILSLPPPSSSIWFASALILTVRIEIWTSELPVSGPALGVFSGSAGFPSESSGFWGARGLNAWSVLWRPNVSIHLLTFALVFSFWLAFAKFTIRVTASWALSCCSLCFFNASASFTGSLAIGFETGSASKCDCLMARSSSAGLRKWFRTASLEELIGLPRLAEPPTLSNDSKKGVGMPRTGSPIASLLSNPRTFFLASLAIFLCFACASIYGSKCFLLSAAVEALATIVMGSGPYEVRVGLRHTAYDQLVMLAKWVIGRWLQCGTPKRDGLGIRGGILGLRGLSMPRVLSFEMSLWEVP